MSSVNFDASGLYSLAASLEKGSAETVKLATAVLGKTAANVSRDAKAAAPVDTGNLRNSIGYQPTGVLEYEIGPTASYGIYLEFGTSRMAPRAYLGPAMDRNSPAFVEAMEQVAERASSGQ